jgi:hypothetical protein
MAPDSIPQISLGTAALLIFAVCAGFVLLRGMTRMVVATLVLGFSIWIGFRVWQIAPAVSVDWTGKSVPWLTTGLPLAAFVITFAVIRKVAAFFVRPFGHSAGGNDKPRSMIGTAFRLLLALIPTSVLCLAGAAIIHHRGSVDEVRAISQNSGTPAETLSQRLKTGLESSLPAAWLERLDPQASPNRLALAKLIATQAETPPTPMIDPQTGRPIPRAMIVDDPELQNLARKGNFGTLLRHPLLTKALDDPNVKALLNDLNR